MFVDKQKMNKNDKLYLIINDFEHCLYKLSLYDFILNLYF